MSLSDTRFRTILGLLWRAVPNIAHPYRSLRSGLAFATRRCRPISGTGMQSFPQNFEPTLLWHVSWSPVTGVASTPRRCKLCSSMRVWMLSAVHLWERHARSHINITVEPSPKTDGVVVAAKSLESLDNYYQNVFRSDLTCG
jgi:hypothetical protein